MINSIYSVEEAANYLDVSIKTIRRYIYNGKISANKIGGKWRITKEQLNDCLRKSSSEEVCKNCDESIDKDDFCIFMDTDYFSSEEKVQICSIVDYYVDDVDLISNMSEVLLKIVTKEGISGDKAQFNYVYDKPLKRARFVLWGTPSFITKATKLLIPFEGDQDEE